MLKNTFNHLLDKYFYMAQPAKLDNLERDVMQRIKLIKEQNSQAWYKKMVETLCIPQFQFASIALALFIGVGISPILTSYQEDNTLQLEDFTYNESHMSLNLNEYLG